MQVVDEDDEESGKKRKVKTVTQVCNDIIREQGYFGFFKGVELGSLQSALQNFVRFSLFLLIAQLAKNSHEVLAPAPCHGGNA